jgi:hypothetical protein
MTEDRAKYLHKKYIILCRLFENKRLYYSGEDCMTDQEYDALEDSFAREYCKSDQWIDDYTYEVGYVKDRHEEYKRLKEYYGSLYVNDISPGVYNSIWTVDDFHFWVKNNLIIYGDESDKPLSIGISQKDLQNRLDKKVQHVCEIHPDNESAIKSFKEKFEKKN